jgi:glycosyltransferase involved in cell wall biosynthesis
VRGRKTISDLRFEWRSSPRRDARFEIMKVLIVIPAYNEAENIAAVIREIRSLGGSADLLVVDDGSSDATAAIAESEGAKVLRLPFNLGYGAAVQTGLIYGFEKGYGACVLTDGDGQHDPRYISDLIAQVEAGEADLALGSRFLGKADYSIPFARRVGMYIFSRLASLFTRQHITDPTSGFQAIGRRLMAFFINDNYPYDFPDADTLIRLYFAGFKIKEVPVTVRPRLHGVSMHGGARTLYYIYKIFFSILIALTQRRMLTSGGHNAADNQNNDGHHQPDSDGGDNTTRATETAR